MARNGPVRAGMPATTANKTIAAELPTTARTRPLTPSGTKTRAASPTRKANSPKAASSAIIVHGSSSPLEKLAVARKFSGTSSVAMISTRRPVYSSFQRW